MQRIIFHILLWTILVLVNGFKVSAQELKVVVTLAPQAYIVKQIAGPLAEVVVLVPDSKNPETYQPSIEQLKQLENAKIYFTLGHPAFLFEKEWISKFANPKLRPINSSNGIKYNEDDPHFWVSITAMKTVAYNVFRALVAEMPDNREQLESNLNNLLSEMDQVLQENQKILGPFSGQKFLVFHPSWQYFAADYGLTQLAIEEEGKELSPSRLRRVIKQAEAAGIKVVFVQPQFSVESAKAVAEALNGKMEVLDPLAGDWLANLNFVAKKLAEELKQ
jgi:zinc transport system substrate-binding protein